MMAFVSQLGGVVMLVGVILMALPVIRAAPWGYTPIFEIGLAFFLFGLLVALLGAIGWLIAIIFAWTVPSYPFPGG